MFLLSLRKAKSTLLALIFCFIVNIFLPYSSKAAVLPYMPNPGQMIGVTANYELPRLVGMRFSSDNPFEFTFILSGGNIDRNETAIKAELAKIHKYFLAALTIPEQDLWVNLSPYEQDRIAPDILSQTELGKDLLGEDYVLKQLAASLTYPESETGKAYWRSINGVGANNHSPATNNFNKVWIVPDKIKILEAKDRMAIDQATLKVMTDEDYLACRHAYRQAGQAGLAVNSNGVGARHASPAVTGGACPSPTANSINAFKTHILPSIEQEVNQGKNFSQFRQIYSALIMAGWFKNKLKNTILNESYLNKSKIKGADTADKAIREKIYNEYVKAFQQGVYNYVKKESVGANDYSPVKRITRRAYFSGGIPAGQIAPAALAGVEAASPTRVDAATAAQDGTIRETVAATPASPAGQPNTQSGTVETKLSPDLLEKLRSHAPERWDLDWVKDENGKWVELHIIDDSDMAGYDAVYLGGGDITTSFYQGTGPLVAVSRRYYQDNRDSESSMQFLLGQAIGKGAVLSKQRIEELLAQAKAASDEVIRFSRELSDIRSVYLDQAGHFASEPSSERTAALTERFESDIRDIRPRLLDADERMVMARATLALGYEPTGDFRKHILAAHRDIISQLTLDLDMQRPDGTFPKAARILNGVPYKDLGDMQSFTDGYVYDKIKMAMTGMLSIKLTPEQEAIGKRLALYGALGSSAAGNDGVTKVDLIQLLNMDMDSVPHIMPSRFVAQLSPSEKAAEEIWSKVMRDLNFSYETGRGVLVDFLKHDAQVLRRMLAHQVERRRLTKASAKLVLEAGLRLRSTLIADFKAGNERLVNRYGLVDGEVILGLTITLGDRNNLIKKATEAFKDVVLSNRLEQVLGHKPTSVEFDTFLYDYVIVRNIERGQSFNEAVDQAIAQSRLAAVIGHKPSLSEFDPVWYAHLNNVELAKQLGVAVLRGRPDKDGNFSKRQRGLPAVAIAQTIEKLVCGRVLRDDERKKFFTKDGELVKSKKGKYIAYLEGLKKTRPAWADVVEDVVYYTYVDAENIVRKGAAGSTVTASDGDTQTELISQAALMPAVDSIMKEYFDAKPISPAQKELIAGSLRTFLDSVRVNNSAQPGNEAVCTHIIGRYLPEMRGVEAILAKAMKLAELNTILGKEANSQELGLVEKTHVYALDTGTFGNYPPMIITQKIAMLMLNGVLLDPHELASYFGSDGQFIKSKSRELQNYLVRMQERLKAGIANGVYLTYAQAKEIVARGLAGKTGATGSGALPSQLSSTEESAQYYWSHEIISNYGSPMLLVNDLNRNLSSAMAFIKKGQVAQGICVYAAYFLGEALLQGFDRSAIQSNYVGSVFNPIGMFDESGEVARHQLQQLRLLPESEFRRKAGEAFEKAVVLSRMVTSLANREPSRVEFDAAWQAHNQVAGAAGSSGGDTTTKLTPEKEAAMEVWNTFVGNYRAKRDIGGLNDFFDNGQFKPGGATGIGYTIGFAQSADEIVGFAIKFLKAAIAEKHREKFGDTANNDTYYPALGWEILPYISANDFATMAQSAMDKALVLHDSGKKREISPSGSAGVGGFAMQNVGQQEVDTARGEVQFSRQKALTEWKNIVGVELKTLSLKF